jgi:hypothetical protein
MLILLKITKNALKLSGKLKIKKLLLFAELLART